jgi:hypothetical protein
MTDTPSNRSSAFEIHSEARGPHWIAWVTRGGGDTPDRAVVLVGNSKEQVETRARQWAEGAGRSEES